MNQGTRLRLRAGRRCAVEAVRRAARLRAATVVETVVEIAAATTPETRDQSLPAGSARSLITTEQLQKRCNKQESGDLTAALFVGTWYLVLGIWCLVPDLPTTSHQPCPATPHHTPLSLPVILKATAAAEARGGKRLRRSAAGTSPRNAVCVSWRVYRPAPYGTSGMRRKRPRV